MSDTPRDFTIDLVAATAYKLEARGRFFGIIEAPLAALDVQFDSGAPLRRGAGGSILLTRHFSRVTLTSAVTQSVRVLVSDDAQDVSNIVSGSGGGPALGSITEEPSAAIATPAVVNVATGAASTIAANGSRRRISIGAPSTNTGSVFIQAVGAGAGRGLELQPGIFIEVKTRAALDVRNDSGAAQDFTTFEET